MAQLIVTSFICDGRYRIHAIGSVGSRVGRIIEIEDVDSGKRFHGSAYRLRQLMLSLWRSYADDFCLSLTKPGGPKQGRKARR